MKKIVIFLISLCFISGCSLVKVSDKSISDILDTVLYVDSKFSNTYMDGYNLYLPKGVIIIDKSDYNLKIKDNKNYYYLYIDTVAYFYKVNNSFQEKSEHFLSKKIDRNGKIGYIDITENGNYYFIVAMYNYAKVESYVKKEDFSSSMISICSILSSIKYNDSVIESNVGNNKVSTQEERFNVFDSNIENDTFLKYESEYGTYKETIDVNKDNDVIDVDETIE